MTKEQFIKRIQLIQNFRSQQETIADLIEKLTDGFVAVNIGDYLIDEIVFMINEALHILDEDLIFWWLYDSSKKIVYIDDREIKVETVEELYDYIKEFYGDDK